MREIHKNVQLAIDGKPMTFRLCKLDAFSGVRYVNVDPVFLFRDGHGDAAFAFHGISGVFAEVFNDPLEQLFVQRQHNWMIGFLERDVHHGRNAGLQVIGEILDNRYDVGVLQYRH